MYLIFYNLECPHLKYGMNCSRECQCENNATCDNIHGTCNCTAGWTGMHCDKPCKDSWGLNCNNKITCLLEHTKYTDHVNGNCYCKPGYEGERYWINC